jgi:hypothetical protein
LTSLTAPRTACVALIIGAFALAACGGGNPAPAPSTAGTASAAPTTSVTPPPATTGPTTAASQAPATLDPSVDPAEDLEIAAPYSLDPLDEAIAQMFITAMRQSAGDMGDLFEFGFRSATRDGQTEAWVIVMGFPDLPITSKALLDQIVEASTSGGGTVEELTIGGEPARLLEQGGQSIVVMLNGDELLMIIGTAKKATVDVAKAIGEAN